LEENSKKSACKDIEVMSEGIKHRNLPSGISGKPCFVLFLASVENRASLEQICKDVEIVTADEVEAADS